MCPEPDHMSLSVSFLMCAPSQITCHMSLSVSLSVSSVICRSFFCARH